MTAVRLAFLCLSISFHIGEGTSSELNAALCAHRESLNESKKRVQISSIYLGLVLFASFFGLAESRPNSEALLEPGAQEEGKRHEQQDGSVFVDVSPRERRNHVLRLVVLDRGGETLMH